MNSMMQTEENGWLRFFIAVSILVLTAIPGSAAQSNVVSIGDVVLDPGNSTIIPIMIYNATDVAGVELNLTYNPDVVNVTDAEPGDFTDIFMPNLMYSDGWVKITTFVMMERELSGNLIVANVTLEAVGSPGDSSPLNMENVVLTNKSGVTMEFVTDNGTFSILGMAPAPVPALTPFGTLVIIGLLCAISATAVRKKRKI